MLKIMGRRYLQFYADLFCLVYLNMYVCSLLSSAINTFSCDLVLIMSFNLPNMGTYRSYN